MQIAIRPKSSTSANIYARRREDGQYIRKCAAFAIGAQDDGQLFG
jgi:hypothetical protein